MFIGTASSAIGSRFPQIIPARRRLRGQAPRSAIAAAGLAALVVASAVAPLELLALAVPLAVARNSASSLAAVAPLERARLEILAVERECVEAITRADRRAVAECCTSDALLVGPGGVVLRGRMGAADNVQYLTDQGVTGLRLEPLEFYAVGDPVAEWGRASFLAGGKTWADVRYLTLWKKEDGRWRMHRDMAAP